VNCFKEGTALCTCWLETSTGLSPTKGGRPASISRAPRQGVDIASTVDGGALGLFGRKVCRGTP